MNDAASVLSSVRGEVGSLNRTGGVGHRRTLAPCWLAVAPSRARQGVTSSMAYETKAGPASELAPGTVHGAGRFAVGNDGQRFAVTRRAVTFAAISHGVRSMTAA